MGTGLEVVPIAAAILDLAVTSVQLIQSCYDIVHQWKTAPDRLQELDSQTTSLEAQLHSLTTWLGDSSVEQELRDSPKSEQAFIKSLRVGEELLNKILKDFPRAPLDPGTKETKKFHTKVSDFFKDTKVRDLATRISQVTAQIHQLRAQTTEDINNGNKSNAVQTNATSIIAQPSSSVASQRAYEPNTLGWWHAIGDYNARNDQETSLFQGQYVEVRSSVHKGWIDVRPEESYVWRRVPRWCIWNESL